VKITWLENKKLYYVNRDLVDIRNIVKSAVLAADSENNQILLVISKTQPAPLLRVYQ